ncbi:MAG: RNase adapter RapZ [Desulfobacterales bacterium]|nr:RNase adapter RapZ [Desulfobacterales bacterium]MDD4070773.1 RNase adapter RapZ [Desulfobacterales bacterium]MDD4391175.1 RNase adapter RapZ [Desulfobacterales bacterium]
MKNLSIHIITGLSGSGKSTAIDAFEDAGFYCVDNMPVALLPKLLKLPLENDSELSGFAFVMDLREKGFLTKYPPVFKFLNQQGYHYSILFMEADEDALVKRYSQTRRHHPLTQCGNLLESIRAEKEQLKALRIAADKIIDTSRFNVHELKAVIFDIAQQSKKFAPMQINVLSFGFKYGIPREADLVIDVRFLSNPFFIPELKPLNGESPEIQNFVLNNPETRIFLQKYLDLLDFLIPLFEKEGKAYLTIAVGCTGGRHRSVTIAKAIYKHLLSGQHTINITHRDIEQDIYTAGSIS